MNPSDILIISIIGGSVLAMWAYERFHPHGKRFCKMEYTELIETLINYGFIHCYQSEMKYVKEEVTVIFKKRSRGFKMYYPSFYRGGKWIDINPENIDELTSLIRKEIRRRNGR